MVEAMCLRTRRVGGGRSIEDVVCCIRTFKLDHDMVRRLRAGDKCCPGLCDEPIRLFDGGASYIHHLVYE